MIKKYINYIAVGLIATTIASCDYNERNFDDIDAGPKNNTTAYHTMNANDYVEIAKALRANKNPQDSALANKITAEQVFSAELSVPQFAPIPLIKRFYTKDVGTAAMLTFDYKGYAQDVLENDIILENIDDKALFEDFNTMPAGTGVAVAKPWIVKDLKGSYKWENRERTVNGVMNRYAQVSSFKSAGENEIWMITRAIDLSAFQAPIFEFDIVAGNYTATCLEVHISVDFTGNENDIAKATWVPITTFTLPTPPAGYSEWASAGKYDMKAYKGKKVYIAFKYLGDDREGVSPKKTTTYQIDNVKVSEAKVKLRRTTQFVFTADHKWAVNPTITFVMGQPDYNAVVEYVKADPILAAIPDILSTKYNSENYYGFNATHNNITYREADRKANPEYAALTTDEARLAFKDQKTIEGMQILLNKKFPNVQPVQDGMEVFANVTALLFDETSRNNWKYKFQRVDETPKWKFISREKLK